MLFKIFQLAVLAFGIWVIVVETKAIIKPKSYPIYRAGEREFF